MVSRTETRAALLLLFLSSLQCLSSAFVIHGRKSSGTTSLKSTPTLEVLEVLEKRINEGTLGDTDASVAFRATESLLSHLDEIESTPPAYDYGEFQLAVSNMDADKVAEMIEAGVEMDEETTNRAFWEVVNAVDQAEAMDKALPSSVPRMLHFIFDADRRHLLSREKITTNVTCMQPDDSGGAEARASAMSYIFDDSTHKDLPLKEGRRCEGGHCCDKCSRNIFPTFAQDHESDLNTFPEIASLTFNDLETVPASVIIQFVRLIERVRRTIAYEYGLPLKTILPLQAYSRKYVAGTTQKGGGGGEGDFVTLHTDEATHDGYHYSCVLYLSTQGQDFEGGNFVFNDPAPKGETESEECDTAKEDCDEVDEGLLKRLASGEFGDETIGDEPLFTEESNVDEETALASLEDKIRAAGRVLTPFHPSRGAAVIFSSGWENMHEVDKITSGVRYAVPAFFTTCPVPDLAYEQMHVGKPKTNEDIADDWLHLLLAHRKEAPTESVGRVKELLMKWHYMCTPLSEH